MPRDRSNWDQITLKVSPATYQRVTEVRGQMKEINGRAVTYSETLDSLVRLWHERAAELARIAQGET
jgi:hypothetical protein